MTEDRIEALEKLFPDGFLIYSRIIRRQTGIDRETVLANSLGVQRSCCATD